MTAVYEDLDVHRVNFILPFFDADFIARVMTVPLDECLLHRFYYRWLRLFSEPVWNTPWQAYRNHEPCPVAFDQAVRAQWNLPDKKLVQHRAATHVLRKALQTADFPDEFLSRKMVRLLYWFHVAGEKRYVYTADTVAAFVDHWVKSDRRARCEQLDTPSLPPSTGAAKARSRLPARTGPDAGGEPRKDS